MTGNEHFTEAEKLIAAVSKRMDSGGFLNTEQTQSRLLAEAQVHATLALVYAANRAQTEAHGLLMAMLEREAELAERVTG